MFVFGVGLLFSKKEKMGEMAGKPVSVFPSNEKNSKSGSPVGVKNSGFL